MPTRVSASATTVDDAAWNVSEMRRLQRPTPMYFHGAEDLPESDDGVLRQED